MTTVIAVPLFQQAAHVREAISSLLAQTDRDLAVLLLDDGSTDGTAALAQAFEQEDDRVTYVRNDHRLGLARNWQKGYELARTQFPDAKYFAWGSDHDRWDPSWLATLRAALESFPSAVLAYPHFERLDGAGAARPRRFVPFSTRGEGSGARRFIRTLIGAPAGRMIYGLFAIDALARTSGFRVVVAPDRLLLLELSLHGEFVQLEDVLWSRRFRHRVSAARQRRAIWPDGAPVWARLPWWIQHPAALASTDAWPWPAALIPPLAAARSAVRGTLWTRARLRRQSRRTRAAVAARVGRR